MRTLSVLFLSLVIVPILVPPNDGGANRSGEDGRFMPQADGSIKWVADSMLHNILRSVMKSFEPLEKVDFYLYTRANPLIPEELYVDDLDVLRESLFNPNHPTRVIVHGWMSNSDLELNTLIRDAYLEVGPQNVIVVNWIRKSVSLYPEAVYYLPKVASRLAALIDFMAKHRYVDPANLTLVGHSLGSHVCGMTARKLKSGKVHTIIGLDPASPMFPYDGKERLHANDAVYVESIQTNSDVSGYEEPVGKATFYPNGGKKQPGCGLDLTGGCAHFRAYKFFAEAIKMGGFPSIRCCTYEKAITKSCGKKVSSVRMGALGNANVAEGYFYVPVKANPPYSDLDA